MVVEAFDKFDDLQQGCDDQDQNPLDNQPMEDPTHDSNFLNDQGQHETLMEAMLAKASTPLYEASSTNMLLAIFCY